MAPQDERSADDCLRLFGLRDSTVANPLDAPGCRAPEARAFTRFPPYLPAAGPAPRGFGTRRCLRRGGVLHSGFPATRFPSQPSLARCPPEFASYFCPRVLG